MPDSGRLRNTLVRAIDALREMPGRRGRTVDLQGATEVLASGDLHGNLDNFRRLLQLGALASHPERHLVLQEIIHGPHRYAGGGDKSHQLVDLVAALVCQFPRQVHFLIGNHELAQATNRKVGKEDDDLNEQFRLGVASAYGAAAGDIYELYCRLFASAPLALRTSGGVLLTHSLPSRTALAEYFEPDALFLDPSRESDLVPRGSIYALLWGRDTSEETAAAFLEKMNARLLVTGHIPCDQGFDTPNSKQLILDCMRSPACYCLFPAARQLSLTELVATVGRLP